MTQPSLDVKISMDFVVLLIGPVILVFQVSPYSSYAFLIYYLYVSYAENAGKPIRRKDEKGTTPIGIESAWM